MVVFAVWLSLGNYTQTRLRFSSVFHTLSVYSCSKRSAELWARQLCMCFFFYNPKRWDGLEGIRTILMVMLRKHQHTSTIHEILDPF